MKSIYIFCLIVMFGLSNMGQIAAEPNVVDKPKLKNKIVQPKGVDKKVHGLTGVKKVGDDTQAVKPENREGLCSPNATLSCETKAVDKGEQVCKQDVCTCVNADGESTYESSSTKYNCVDKVPEVPEPTEKTTPEMG